MKYDKIVEAIFIERPNRFIARVKIDGAEEVELVHVKNTKKIKIYYPLLPKNEKRTE